MARLKVHLSERFWKWTQPLRARRRVKAAIPGDQNDVIARQHERGREVQRIQATQVPVDRKSRSMLDERLVDFDDSERRPLLPHGLRRLAAGGEADRSDSLDEADTAHVPALGPVHRFAHEIAVRRLLDVPLDQRAGI